VADPEARIDAKNRDFARFEQVKKEQEYRLAEAEAAEQFDEDFRIRTCDLGKFFTAPRKTGARSRKSWRGLEQIGFAILEGHGVDPRLYEEASAKTVEVFTRPTPEEKLRYRAERHGSVNQGYFPIKETSDIHPDLVEAGSSAVAPSIWTATLRGRIAGRISGRSQRRATLSPPLSGAREADPPDHAERSAVPGCDPHLYDRRLSATNFGLRLNFYPPVRPEDDASGAARLLGHEDVDLFTLVPAPQIEGSRS